MSGASPGVLWDIRDDRTLSAYAKLAYLMLWSRKPDIRPSMQTLADDMAVSVATAKRAVRDLEKAGLLRRTARLTEHGDHDTNQFVLARPAQGRVSQTPPPGHTDPTPPVSQTPKDSNLKTSSEGRNSLASRRAQNSVSREQPSDDQMIRHVKAAISEIYGEREAILVEDEQALDLYGYYVGDRNPRKPVSYLVKIFADAPAIDTLLINAVGSEQAAEGLDAIAYGRCLVCQKPFDERVRPQESGLCIWCNDAAGSAGPEQGVGRQPA